MKTATLKNRLEKRFTGSKCSIAYKMVIEFIESDCKNNVIRTCYTSGQGRFLRNQDHTYGVESLLTLLGVKYQYGNDAPRGGATGKFVKVITKFN